MDIVGRLEGEAFCVLCPNADIHNTKRIFNKLRKGAADLVLKSDKIQFTVSIDVGVRSEKKGQLHQMVANADKSFCWAKETGRNRVVTCDELSQEDEST